jgi:Restriction endonuclease
MSHHHEPRSPEWREFEQLVARIETDAAELGFTVKSPDRVRCRVTGKLREVDATIRGPANDLDKFITIECRRRRTRQDVTWIEQLATKRQSIGAARTIAVSSSGFSEAAHTLAHSHGIELRTMQEVSLEEINPYAQLDLVWFWHRKAFVDAIGLRFFRSHAWKLPVQGDADIVLPTETDLFAPIFRNVEEGQSWSVNDIWLQLQAVTDPFTGIRRGKKPVVRTACFPYPGNVSIETPDGPKTLGDVLLRVALSLEAEQVSLEEATKVEYASRADALQRVEFASSRPESKDWRISLQVPKNATDLRDLKTGGNWPSAKRKNL